MIAGQLLSLALLHGLRALAQQEVLPPAARRQGHLADDLEPVALLQGQEGAQRQDAEIGPLLLDVGLGALTAGHVLALGRRPPVDLGGHPQQGVQVGLGLGAASHRVFPQHQHLDRFVRADVERER
jgi:hypothetical protein